MKKIYILGNWKSNKTRKDAEVWRDTFAETFPVLPPSCTVILCPSYTHLSVFDGQGYALGVQDISPFAIGAYTGEVAAGMVANQVRYALLGHSERRTHLGETDELIAKKVHEAVTEGIIPIVCVSSLAQAAALKRLVPAYAETGMLLYEPLTAIGSGVADTPENANAMAQQITAILPVPVLYGGSVVPANVKGYVESEYLSGVGVGGASLDARKFSDLINAAI